MIGAVLRRAGHQKDRRDLYRLVDADYYGYGDDEDGELELTESKAETLALEAALEEWKDIQRNQNLDPDAILELIKTQGPSASSNHARAMEEHFTSHLQLPSREEMEHMLLERRKQALLATYMESDDM